MKESINRQINQLTTSSVYQNINRNLIQINLQIRTLYYQIIQSETRSVNGNQYKSITRPQQSPGQWIIRFITRSLQQLINTKINHQRPDQSSRRLLINKGWFRPPCNPSKKKLITLTTPLSALAAFLYSGTRFLQCPHQGA